MWSCKAKPILPISRFSPQAISLHTSSTLSFIASLLHSGDDNGDNEDGEDDAVKSKLCKSVLIPDAFLWSDSHVILSKMLGLMKSASAGFFFCCLTWWCILPASCLKVSLFYIYPYALNEMTTKNKIVGKILKQNLFSRHIGSYVVTSCIIAIISHVWNYVLQNFV